MGLPVWREPPAKEEPLKINTDPTATARSTIRRATRVPEDRLRERMRRRADPEQNAAQTASDSNLRRRIERNTQTQVDPGSSRPRSRRGPSFSEGHPLRRYGHRRIVDEMDSSSAQMEIDRYGNTASGLGDRRRSWSRDNESDAWAVMGSTIEPDPSLPSASTSFSAPHMAPTPPLGSTTQLGSPDDGQTEITSFFSLDGDAADEGELRARGERERSRREGLDEMRAAIESSRQAALQEHEERRLAEEASTLQHSRSGTGDRPERALTTSYYQRRTTDSRQRSPPTRQRTLRENPARAPTPPSNLLEFTTDVDPTPRPAYDHVIQSSRPWYDPVDPMSEFIGTRSPAAHAPFSDNEEADAPHSISADAGWEAPPSHSTANTQRHERLDPLGTRFLESFATFMDSWRERGVEATSDTLLRLQAVVNVAQTNGIQETR